MDPITNTPPPLHTYHRRQPAQPTDSSSDEHPSEHMVSPTTEPLSEPDDTINLPDSPPTPITPSVLDPDLDRPVAERKGTRSTRNPYPIYNFLSYHRLSPSYTAFVSSLSSVSTPKNLREALTDPRWRQAMVDEMNALHSTGTWDLVPLPPGKSTVGCRWVYTVKVNLDGNIDRLKARLVAKGYTQVYGLDYSDTFPPVAKMTSIRIFLSMVAIH